MKKFTFIFEDYIYLTLFNDDNTHFVTTVGYKQGPKKQSVVNQIYYSVFTFEEFQYYEQITNNEYCLDELHVILQSLYDRIEITKFTVDYNMILLKCLIRTLKKRIRTINVLLRYYNKITNNFADTLQPIIIQQLYHYCDEKNNGSLKNLKLSPNPNTEEILEIFYTLNIVINFKLLKDFVESKNDTRKLLKQMKLKWTNTKKESKNRIILKFEEDWNKFNKLINTENINLRTIPPEVHNYIKSFIGN